jgi:hypothetical protein
MADTASIELREGLARVAEEKGIPPDLIRRALALDFPADAIKQQIQMPGVTAEQVEEFISEQERMRAGGEITIPDDLAAAAAAAGWPEELMKRALKLGAGPAMLMRQMEARVPPERAEQFIEQQERIREGGAAAALDLSWMKVPTEWGVRVRPGKSGLTIGMLNVGTYGDIPDHWPYQTEMPRGAYPISGVPAMGYSIYEKAELWSDNSADLYEEAIQRRWRPATDIPWETIEDLPDEVERAMCQLCTVICEKALLAGDVVGKWLPEMSYGYHEVKVFLASAEFDVARQFEVFRKRALSNGGGMGLQSPGYLHRAVIDARTWTETSIVLHILFGSHLLSLYQIGSMTAHNEAEAKIFALTTQDVARQIAYGIQHLKYFLARNPERRPEIHAYLNKAEAIFAFEDEQDTPLREALMILLGGGISREQIVDGARQLDRFQRRWVGEYLERLNVAGVPDREEKLHPRLAAYVRQSAAAEAA